MASILDRYTNELETLSSPKRLRQRRILTSDDGMAVRFGKHRLINFATNDYLGFTKNPKLKQTLIDAVKEYGIGVASSQLLSGYHESHHRLELKLAKFLQRDAAILFGSGYQANLAFASTFINRHDVVIQDKLNHASLIDTARLSGACLLRYAHNDINALAQILASTNKHKIVMTDAVFSMDGDVALLTDISQLCQQHDALLIVDDAHGFGVLGEQGRGTIAEFQLSQEQCPLVMATFAKASGCAGAFIAGQKSLLELIVQKARTYIYTTALMPALAETASAALDLLMEDKHRQKLKQLIAHYQSVMATTNLPYNKTMTAIQPFIVGDAEATMQLSDELLKEGFLVPAIRPPTVAHNQSRLRISLSAAHEMADIDRLLTTLQKLSN